MPRANPKKGSKGSSAGMQVRQSSARVGTRVNTHFQVRKRNGKLEEVYFDKITSRIKKLCYNLRMDIVNPSKITIKVIDGIYNEVTTVELDNLAAETAAQMAVIHPDYSILAARIAVSNLHKETKKQFSEVITDLYNMRNKINNKSMPLISKVSVKIRL